MTLYEAILLRKSVRKYNMGRLDETMLNNIMSFAKSVPLLIEDIDVQFRIMEYSELKSKSNGNLSIKAPYYMVLYSKKSPNHLMNGGYLMEQVSLYLTAKGLGSCYLGKVNLKKSKLEGTDLELIITLGFGEGERDVYRQNDKAKRLPLKDIATIKDDIDKNMKAVLTAARLAPSSMNSQPWRFVVYENRIHIFCKKNIFLRGLLNEIKMVDIGICIAHILITAEELWLDAKTMSMNNISNQNFKKNDYVITVKMS